MVYSLSLFLVSVWNEGVSAWLPLQGDRRIRTDSSAPRLPLSFQKLEEQAMEACL